MNPLKGSLVSRLIAVVIVSIPFGLFYAHYEQRKVEAWSQNPAAAQAVQLHISGRMSSFWMATISIAVWLVILTLCIEGVSYLIRGEWQKHGVGGQSA